MLQAADAAIVQGPLFGGAEGDNFNDIVTLGWPGSKPLDTLKPIAQIVVRSGWVIDALNVTYNLHGGGTKTINHGNQAGGNPQTIDIAADEVITSVIGKAGPHSFYKKNFVQQLYFVIANTQTSQVRLVGPFGNGDQTNQGTFFQASGVQGFAGSHSDAAGIFGLSFVASKAWL